MRSVDHGSCELPSVGLRVVSLPLLMKILHDLSYQNARDCTSLVYKGPCRISTINRIMLVLESLLIKDPCPSTAV